MVKTLEELLKNRIQEKGFMTFSDFMEKVLYHPQLGYYSKTSALNPLSKERKEEREDYYTSVDVHPIFGRIVAQFVYGEWKKTFKDKKNFYLIELGCGSGKLAKEILQWLLDSAPQCFNALTYIGIEISAKRRELFSELKSLFGEHVCALKEFDFPDYFIDGIIFSNEFFDALPFHRVCKKDGQLQELFIDKDLKEFFSNLTPEVEDYFHWLGAEPMERCMGEAHLKTREWIGKIARALRKGSILTIDYGYEVGELYSEIRSEGTAVCHFRHQRNNNFYENLGNQDITSHVNFSTLMEEAKSWGFSSSTLKTQSQFLIENGLEEMVKTMQLTQDIRLRLKASSAIKSLIHPEGMGGTFKVLIQKK